MELRFEGAIISVFRLTKVIHTIGRTKRASIIVPDPFVSSIHCQLSRLDSGLWALTDGDLIRNKPSTHGTFLNGKKLEIDEGIIVSHGDVITVGKSQAIVWEEEERTKAIDEDAPTYY
jgi:pSer/pThr/pTyr-binding forkhead associated (FHA) protein